MVYVHNLDPIILTLGPLEFRWYGLVYALSFLFMLWYLGKAADEGRIENLDRKRATDLVAFSILGMIIGARIMHVLTTWGYYSKNPIEILMIHHGGLAFFGAFLGIAAVTIYFSHRWGYPFGDLADVFVVPIPLFLFFGRIANFVNGELPGKVVDAGAWFAVQFPYAAGPRHPSQLYEALLMLGAFVVLYLLSKKNFRRGLVFWAFVALYGALRFIVEFFRELDDFAPLGFSWMHYVTFAMIVVGGYQVFNLLARRSD